ncbi:isoprenoid synthase domain-containing protein [Amylocystis lapponica]|nr:isoprenoid synthase domain-containing protein [Amylocystis lapponica]
MSESPRKDVVILKFPDLLSYIPFPLRYSPHVEKVSKESEEWLDSLARFTPKQRARFFQLNAGLLASTCYVDCGFDELRCCADFLNYLFNLDDWSDEFDTTGTAGLAECVMNTLYEPETYKSDAVASVITRDFWLRMLKSIGPNAKKRFIDTMDLYFQAIMQQASDRASGSVPDLESYVPLRRDTSGCKTGFVLVEYACHIDLPNEVVEHPVMAEIMNATNDNISWSNDILSYNREQSRGDSHNLIPVIMNSLGLDLQSAIYYAGELCNKTIDRFLAGKAALPSWGPEVDAQVALYMQGLEDWISGNGDWSFVTKRYFGEAGPEVRKSLQVELLPLRGFD